MRIATNITNFSKAPAMHRGKTLRRRSARDRRGELGESIELAATAQAAVRRRSCAWRRAWPAPSRSSWWYSRQSRFTRT